MMTGAKRRPPSGRGTLQPSLEATDPGTVTMGFPWDWTDRASVDFSNPITILIHDGELADVRNLLEELGASFVERLGKATPEDGQTSWDLVVATPKRMLQFEVSESFPSPVRIAVVADDARTLRNMLKRSTIEFVVRRPVHPAALRLLVLHALYRGPEKREFPRVTVGAPIRFRVGWRWRRAILMDLSARGCRLLSPDRVRRGDLMELNLPSELTGRASLSLTGRVMRCRTPVPGWPGKDGIAVNFEALSGEAARRLQATIECYASGPAALPSSIARRYGIDDAALPPLCGSTHPGEEGHHEIPSGDSEAAAAPDAATAKERAPRGVRGERRLYARRVIALGDEITRILIGRDLSVGGMRVDPHPELSVGDAMQIALYARAGEQPLVVSAEVSRDDANQGLALQFHDLSRAAKSYLGRMVGSLPYLEIREEGAEGESAVISEIIDRELG